MLIRTAELAAASALLLAACGARDPDGAAAFEGPDIVPASAETPAEAPTPAPETPSRAFIETFETLNERDWYIAHDFFIDEAWFDTVWDRNRITRLGPGLRYDLTHAEHPEKAFSGASIQRIGNDGFGDKFHYGRYETVMTAAAGDGLVSAFFTYTGEWFGDEQHEIDFEFLGKDTTQVQLNYHLRGASDHEQLIDLGYDAVDTPNLYAFEWEPGEIRWYVGDVLVHRETGAEDDLPSLPGLIFSQLWAGGAPTANWLGQPVSLDRPEADVFCISFRELWADAPQCSDTFEAINTATPAPTVAE